MIFSFGGSGGGTQLRPMERGDFGAVLRIISSHDEDDFEEAREELRDDFEGMFVLTVRGKVVAVTGTHVDPHSADVVWLPWTYVDVARQGNGLGRTMIEQLLEMLRADGMRKLCINTRDHREDAVDTYAAARAFYGKNGRPPGSHTARLSHRSRVPPHLRPRPCRLACSQRAPHRRRPALHRYRAFAPKARVALASSGKKSKTPPRPPPSIPNSGTGSMRPAVAAPASCSQPFPPTCAQTSTNHYKPRASFIAATSSTTSVPTSTRNWAPCGCAELHAQPAAVAWSPARSDLHFHHRLFGLKWRQPGRSTMPGRSPGMPAITTQRRRLSPIYLITPLTTPT